jgi:hypothetical protein
MIDMSTCGEPIDEKNLSVPKAIQTVRAIKGHPYFKLLECRRTAEDNEEILVTDVDVETCQKPVYDIRSSERIAIRFSAAEDKEPEVTALRDDFPTRVPHRRLSRTERPVSLCLYEEPYRELKLHWTPYLFLERIREWLALTARDETHQSDQPLEPILGGSPIRLIIPWSVLLSPESNEPLVIRSSPCGENRFTLIAEWISKVPKTSPSAFKYLALAIETSPQVHGVINRQPATLADLHDFLKGAGMDLVTDLRRRLKELNDDDKYKGLLDKHLILVAHIPIKRNEGTPPEASNIWAFVTIDTIKNLGVKTGTWDLHDNVVGALVPPDGSRDGSDAKIEMLSPTPLLSKEWAAKASGLDKADERSIILIGAGALGSHVFFNLVRMGYGPWIVVDDEWLLPHILARHALFRGHLGFSKAEMLAAEANGLIDDGLIAEAMVVNVLEPPTQVKIADSYEKASIIIDASTSLAVERHLARDVVSPARRISVFLNPTGTDSVLLAEDSGRRITLDCLEMQYYRALTNVPELDGHLRMQTGAIRYARSCRDISLTIPQDSVALHSAACTRGIRNAIATPDPQILIWRTGETFSVESISVVVYEVIEQRVGEWTIYTDTWFLRRVQQLRENKLPNETGGLLIGAFDMERKIIYVVDTIPSTPDSLEWPTTYIRGCEGLLNSVKEVRAKTADNLEYVGEWHSHPFGCQASLSADDVKALEWLRGMMNSQGLPAFMLIVGNAGERSWNIAEPA